MEIINDGGAQNTTPNTNPTPAPSPQPQGCLAVAAKVIMGIIFFLSATTFLGCTIGAVVLPIVASELDFGIWGVDIIDGAIYIAELVCILCALGAAIVAYLSFCITFTKRVRGWALALLLVLFVGGAIGGSIYGVKVGLGLFDDIDEIEQLDWMLDGIDEEDSESFFRALLAGQGERDINLTLDDDEDMGLLLALDLDSSVTERIMSVIVLQDKEVRMSIKQDIDRDGVGTREISIRLPDEDINILQTLPITPLPSALAE